MTKFDISCAFQKRRSPYGDAIAFFSNMKTINLEIFSGHEGIHSIETSLVKKLLEFLLICTFIS